MKKISVFILCLQWVISSSDAQSNIDTLLEQIQSTNMEIGSNTKYWDAKGLEYKTGLTPMNPFIEYDYLFGSPTGLGNQQELNIIQQVDFPTVYSRKKDLSNKQISQAQMQKNVFRQDILLASKLLLYDLIYLNTKESQLLERQQKSAQFLQEYEQKLQQGDANMLDVNKIKLQYLSIKNDLLLLQNEKQTLLTKLAELNGGVWVDFTDTLYPAIPLIPDFETLDSIIESNDPLIALYEQEKIIQQQQVYVQKSLNLPKLEAGYHGQTILNTRLQGIHAGITVPLWENKHKVKAAEANVDFATTNIQRHRLEHRLENRRLYDLLEVRQNAMEEYEELLSTMGNTVLLDKALRLGELTIIQYFLEQSYFYTAYDKNEQLKREYHKAVAELYKYTL
ncbi:MAG: TolC family protein [Saprospiraceae bacterium]|nr:TolC family protein [Candidatus Opimibacter iunctus]